MLFEPQLQTRLNVIPPAHLGATLRPVRITWQDTEGDPIDLTGLKLSGCIQNTDSEVIFDLTGTLTIEDAEAGIFSWHYSAADVAEIGTYLVQFRMARADNPASYDLSYVASWRVLEALCIGT